MLFPVEEAGAADVCGEAGAPTLLVVDARGGVEGFSLLAKLEKELLLLPAVGAAGDVCRDAGAPKLFAGGGGVEDFPLVAKLENELSFRVGGDGEVGAPKLLLAFALAAGVDGAPKFDVGADCCLAK